jgi:basic amino acid/polyamine antiporter, APA family
MPLADVKPLTSRPKLFTRDATGLVRNASLLDAFLFGLSCSIPFAANFYLYPFYTYILPGADWTVASIIALVFAIPIYIVYAGLGSMMPRAGGDYVFQSRGVHPIWALISSIGWTVFLVIPFFSVLLLVSSVSLGFVPLFTIGGAVTGNSALASASTWLSSPVGTFTFTALAIIITALVSIAGIKTMARAFRYAFLPITLITGITLIYLFASTSPTAFQNDFNHYMTILNGTSNSYSTVLSATAKAGFTTPAFSWVNTLLLATVITVTFLMWAAWSSPVLGEIRGGGNLRNLLVTFGTAGAFQTFFLLAPELYGFQHSVGTNFMNAVSYSAYTPGVVSLPFFPSVAIFSLMMTTSPLIMVLASVGYIMVGWAQLQTAFFNGSRYFLAGSIDGLLPAWLTAPQKRFGAAFYCVMAMFVLLMSYAFVLDFYPSLSTYVAIAVWSSPGIFFGTSLAAILIPWRRKQIYSNSPIAKYKGLLPICGIIGFAITGFVLIGYLVIPQMLAGLSSRGAVIVISVVVMAVIWYFAFQRYKLSKGQDISLAYKEIPPE